MPFIPHTETDVKTMLAAIGVTSIDQLFEEIPERLRAGRLTQVPEGMSEMEVTRLMSARANIDGSAKIDLAIMTGHAQPLARFRAEATVLFGRNVKQERLQAWMRDAFGIGSDVMLLQDGPKPLALAPYRVVIK